MLKSCPAPPAVPSRRRGTYAHSSLLSQLHPDGGGLQQDRQQTQREQLLPLQETSQRLWGLARDGVQASVDQQRQRHLCLAGQHPLGSNQKPSLGTARLLSDPLAADDRLSFKGTIPARRQSRAGLSQPFPLPLQQLWAESQYVSCSGARSSAGEIRDKLLTGASLYAPDASKGSKPSLRRAIKRDGTCDWFPCSRPGESSQMAAGFL